MPRLGKSTARRPARRGPCRLPERLSERERELLEEFAAGRRGHGRGGTTMTDRRRARPTIARSRPRPSWSTCRRHASATTSGSAWSRPSRVEGRRRLLRRIRAGPAAQDPPPARRPRPRHAPGSRSCCACSTRSTATRGAATRRLDAGGPRWRSTRTSSPRRPRRRSSPPSAWPRSATTPSSSRSTCCRARSTRRAASCRPILEKLGVPPARRPRGARAGARAASPRLRPDPGPRLEPASARLRHGARARPSGSRTSTSRPSTSCSPSPTTRRPARPARLLRRLGVTRDRLYQALQEVRGGQRVTSPNPETTYQALEKYGRDLTALARQGKLDPVIGRDEEIRRVIQVLSPADQEQPGPDRRAGRRQDRDRRGAGPADRPRRRARGPQGQAGRRARPRRAGRRRQVPRRVRGAAQGRPQGGHRLGRARSSCSSTSCTRSSAPARPRARWTPPTCSSRCSPAASCTASARPRSTSTASTSRRTPRSSAASSRSSSASRRSRTRSRSCAACASATSSTTSVRIKDAALVAAAVLSHRYIADRFLPDKAIDLVDEAAAKLRMEATSMPAELDEVRRRIMQLEIEREGLRKEKDAASKERLERLEKELADAEGGGRPARGALAERGRGAQQGRPASRRSSTRRGRELEQASLQADWERAARLQVRGRRAREASSRRPSRRCASAARAAARWSRRRSTRRTSPRSSAAGPASRSAGCSRARSRS